MRHHKGFRVLKETFGHVTSNIERKMDIKKVFRKRLKYIDAVGSVVDIYPQSRTYRVTLGDQATDAQAIFQDWLSVGEQLRQATSDWQKLNDLNEVKIHQRAL